MSLEDEFSVLEFPVQIQEPTHQEVQQLVSEYNSLQERLATMEGQLAFLVEKVDTAEKMLPKVAETMQLAMSQTPIGKLLLKALGIH